MALVIFDTETTSLNGDVVELGSVIITDSGGKYHFNERCRPLREPIQAGAEKVHGISNQDVAHCRTSKEVVESWFEDIMGLGEDVIFCAHNILFDMRILFQHKSLYSMKSFCTLELARCNFPDLPNHKLGTLYDKLELERVNAHSALDDCIMVERVLPYLLRGGSWHDVVAKQKPTFLPAVEHGKTHVGKPFSAVSTRDLTWMIENMTNGKFSNLRNIHYTAGVTLEQRK